MREYLVRVYEDRTEYRDSKTGELHRIDGPAVEYKNGTKVWYREGKRHRIDGPAVECKDGSKEYWIEGKKVTEDRVLKKKVKISIKDVEIELSKEDIEVLKEMLKGV